LQVDKFADHNARAKLFNSIDGGRVDAFSGLKGTIQPAGAATLLDHEAAAAFI